MCRCYCDLSAIDHGGIQVAGYVYGWTAGNFLGLQRAIAEAHKLASVIAEEDLRAATEWSILAVMKMHAVSPI